MKYSVIIPTMYFHVEQLTKMLIVYESIVCIGEVLIINNNKEKQVDLNFSKVRTIGNGNNLYVNPSWTYGAENAKFDNIIIANDDINIIGNLESLLNVLLTILNDNRVFGPSMYCFDKFNKNTNGQIKIKPSVSKSKFVINYGFGVFMCMTKTLFQNTNIPDDFKIWYGDHILYLRNEPWEFSGINIKTNMRGTTSKLNLYDFMVSEKLAFSKLKA